MKRSLHKATGMHVLILLLTAAAVWPAYAHAYQFSYKQRLDSALILKDSAADSTPPKTSYIDASAEYGSNFTYRHQIDQTPTQAPYLYPTIFYHNKHGFWASFGSYRLLTPYVDQKADGKDTSLSPSWIEADLSAGWDFKFGDNTDASVSYMYSRYDRKYPLVAQALANTFEGYLGHDFKLINVGARFDYSYQNFEATINAKKQSLNVTDYFGFLEISKEWFIDDAFFKGDEFDINPMFTTLAGTNNFIGRFITLRYPEGTKYGKQAAAYAAKASKFLIQQFTLNVPVAYTIGDVTVTPSFEYTVLTQKKTETEPTSYPIYRISVAYRLNFKNKP